MLFERPWWLATVLVVMQIGIVTVWWWRRDRPWARAVWIGLGSSVALLMLSYFVVTPTEQLVRLCHTLAALAQEEDVQGIESHLTETFVAGEFDRRAFIGQAEATLQRVDLEHAKLRAFRVDFSDRRRGTAEFNAICRIAAPNFTSGIIISRWRLTFLRPGDSWRVDRIEVIPTAFSPIRHVRDCFR